jgi:cytochrome o ubiquinol oxidase subunit 1
VLPRVETIDAFWEMKRKGARQPGAGYAPIEMPRNSPTGFIISFFAVVAGFALIWHIWWMAILGLLGAAITMLAFGWSDEREHEIPAAELARAERARARLGGAA